MKENIESINKTDKKTINNGAKKITNKELVIYFLLSLCLVIVFLLIGKMKAGYHEDEIATYFLSNHQYEKTNSISVKVNDGEIYNGKELYLDSLSVTKNKKFDYANVWQNQAKDVHPPFYYVLIHTASSLFPDFSIKKIGFLVHIPLAIIVFWQYIWIAQKLNLSFTKSIFLALAYVLSFGFIDSEVIFFRMYTLLTICANFLIMLFLKYKAEDPGNVPYYIFLGIVLYCGFLTQYLFIFYTLFVCLIYAIAVIRVKNWKKLIFSIVTCMLSLLLTYFTFPAMKNHFFETKRAQQAIEGPQGGYISTLLKHLELVNMSVFGGLLVVVVVLIILVSIYIHFKGNKEKHNYFPYLILILPSCLFELVVARVTPLIAFRYSVISTGALFIGLMALMIYLCEHINKSLSKVVMALMVIMLCLSVNFGLKENNLYLKEKHYISTIKKNSNFHCIYLYNDRWKIGQSLPKIRYLRNIVFINIKKWDNNKKIIEKYLDEPVIVFIDNNYIDMLDDVKKCINANNAEELFSSGHTHTYLLR